MFVDTNFFVALYNPADLQHKKALTAAKQIQKDEPELILSSFVFLEVVTVLSQRAGKSLAIKAGQRLRNADAFTFIQSTTKLEQTSWEIFQEINKKNISFVDCSIIAVMKQESIPLLLTFDLEDFKILGKQYKFTLYS